MEHYDKIRLVVVGDSGVGKTSLVHILCHNEALRHPTWTIGCSVHVKMHTHSRNSKTYFVEFIDVGGTSKHKSSRNMFYHQINGIILVHDVSNRKSYHNLWKWIAEVIYSEAYKESERVNNVANANWSMGSGSGSGSWMSGSSMSFNSTNDYDFELQIGERHASVPILVVGTKADLVKQELTGRQRRYSIVDEYGGECVNLCTLAPTHFAQNSISAQKIDAFFEKVIDKKFGITTDHYQNVTSGSFTTSIPTVTKKQSWNGFRQPIIDDSSLFLRTSRESLVSSTRSSNSTGLRESSLSKSNSVTNLRESFNGNMAPIRRGSLRPFD